MTKWPVIIVAFWLAGCRSDKSVEHVQRPSPPPAPVPQKVDRGSVRPMPLRIHHETPAPLPTPYGPGRVSQARETRMPGVRVLYPMTVEGRFRQQHVFEVGSMTNLCTMQINRGSRWEDLRSWIPERRVVIYSTNRTHYRLLVPVAMARKNE